MVLCSQMAAQVSGIIFCAYGKNKEKGVMSGLLFLTEE